MSIISAKKFMKKKMTKKTFVGNGKFRPKLFCVLIRHVTRVVKVTHMPNQK